MYLFSAVDGLFARCGVQVRARTMSIRADLQTAGRDRESPPKKNSGFSS